MPRFYVSGLLNVGQVLMLSERVAHHLRVLRVREGQHITLFNGSGGEFCAVLTIISRREIHCRIEKFIAVSRESPIWVGLIQGISTADRMDFTLQKGVEMGVSAFQPILTERSIVKFVGEKANQRVARWQEIVRGACEQCGRTVLPEVRPILRIADCLQIDAGEARRLILSPAGNGHLNKQVSRPNRAWLMVGPEGGFSEAEETAAVESGWSPWKLGPRTLRTETAALAAVAAIETVWGDYSV